MSRELARIQRLARRVGWLDRYRRILAIACAVVISPLLISHLAEVLGVDWPRLHTTALSTMLGFFVWCAIEVGLVWLTALWETEWAQLTRDRGLPRAVVHKR